MLGLKNLTMHKKLFTGFVDLIKLIQVILKFNQLTLNYFKKHLRQNINLVSFYDAYKMHSTFKFKPVYVTLFFKSIYTTCNVISVIAATELKWLSIYKQ